MILGVLFFSTAIVLLGIDCWDWQSTGQFIPLSLAAIFHAAGAYEPSFESDAAKFIVTAVFHFPLSLVFAFAGIVSIAWNR